MRRLATVLDLLGGLLAGLAHDLTGLGVGRLALLGGVGVGLLAGLLGLPDLLLGLLLGALAAFLKALQQFLHLLGRLILLGGDVGANLLHLRIPPGSSSACGSPRRHR